MNLVVLGAGRGTRLRPITDDVPKPLVEIDDGVTILGSTLSNASDLVDEAVIVSGYLSDVLRQWNVEQQWELKVTIEYNDDFDTKGPIVSLAKAKEYLQTDDFVIVNGDTYYDRTVFDAIENIDEEGITLLVSRETDPDPDSMKVLLNGNSIKEIGKSFTIHSTEFVSAGALLVRGDSVRKDFLETLDRFVEDQPNCYWHDLVGDLAAKGYRIKPYQVRRNSWREIDTPADLREVRATITP